MGDSYRIKRTAVGSATGSTIAVALSVTVILDAPAERDDTFELLGADGRYAKQLHAADADALVTGETILHYTGVRPKHGYRLIQHRSAEYKRPIFLDTPLESMTEAGHGATHAKYEYVLYPTQAPKLLPDNYGVDRDVDADLVQTSPSLLLQVAQDPKL